MKNQRCQRHFLMHLSKVEPLNAVDGAFSTVAQACLPAVHNCCISLNLSYNYTYEKLRFYLLVFCKNLLFRNEYRPAAFPL